ncbi:MAG: hypothetical protein ACO3J2_05330 [Chthoniobacterales bacterium]
MTTHARRLAAAAALTALAAAGCENMTAGENALIAAGLAGAATGIALGTTGVPVGTTLPVALGAAAGAGALGYGVSKMQVNSDQRLFAEQRGRSIVEQAYGRGATNIPRYILVDTIAEKPSGGRPVMVYDTASGRVASRRIYYINMPPGPYGYVEAPAGMLGGG